LVLKLTRIIVKELFTNHWILVTSKFLYPILNCWTCSCRMSSMVKLRI
jgi:hypothetical protein